MKKIPLMIYWPKILAHNMQLKMVLVIKTDADFRLRNKIKNYQIRNTFSKITLQCSTDDIYMCVCRHACMWIPMFIYSFLKIYSYVACSSFMRTQRHLRDQEINVKWKKTTDQSDASVKEEMKEAAPFKALLLAFVFPLHFKSKQNKLLYSWNTVCYIPGGGEGRMTMSK